MSELKQDAQVRKFMAKYRYQYHQTMLQDLVDLIDSKVQAEEVAAMESYNKVLVKSLTKHKHSHPILSVTVKEGKQTDRVDEVVDVPVSEAIDIVKDTFKQLEGGK